MLSHATARDWLIPYADGMLAADERRRIDGHITGCAACAAELREVRELNLLLVTLPPAPPVAVATFWLKLQAVLPQRRALRIPTFAGYRRLSVAFAVAAIAALAAASTAFAAPSALPDNPLYPVKQLEENVRLALTPANERLTVQLQLASERLREAQAMAADHKTRLAENSLRAFTNIVSDAAVSLRHPANPLAAKDALRALHLKLDAVERINASRDDDMAGIKELVAAAGDELDRIEQLESVSVPALVIGEQATPDPTPQVTAKPVPGPTPPDDRESRDRHD
jgi:anti-sigma factor RsiW